MPPSFPVELLGSPPAPAVELAVVLRRVTGCEELRLPQQRLDRLASGQQARHQLALLTLAIGAGAPLPHAASRCFGGNIVVRGSRPRQVRIRAAGTVPSRPQPRACSASAARAAPRPVRISGS